MMELFKKDKKQAQIGSNSTSAYSYISIEKELESISNSNNIEAIEGFLKKIDKNFKYWQTLLKESEKKLKEAKVKKRNFVGAAIVVGLATPATAITIVAIIALSLVTSQFFIPIIIAAAFAAIAITAASFFIKQVTFKKDLTEKFVDKIVNTFVKPKIIEGIKNFIKSKIAAIKNHYIKLTDELDDAAKNFNDLKEKLTEAGNKKTVLEKIVKDVKELTNPSSKKPTKEAKLSLDVVENMRDVGINIILKYLDALSQSSGNPPWETLDLSLKLTQDGINALAASMSEQAFNNLNIRTIDLSGSSGVITKSLVDALYSNLTITAIHYNIVHPEPEHMEKLLAITQQNIAFVSLSGSLRVDTKNHSTVSSTFLQAYSLDPVRCMDYFAKNSPDTMKQIRGSMLASGDILKLRDSSSGKNSARTLGVLKTLFEEPGIKPEVLENRVKIFTQLLEMSSDKDFINDAFRVLRESDKDTLQKAQELFKQLRDTMLQNTSPGTTARTTKKTRILFKSSSTKCFNC